MTYVFLIIILSAFAVIDLRTSRIPNPYILIMVLLLGTCYMLEKPLLTLHWKSLLLSLLISALFYKYRILGAADLKVLIAISPFFDEISLMFILLCSMFLFTLVMLMMRRLRLFKTIKRLRFGFIDTLNTSPFLWAYIMPVILCCY